jgi:hypothetical protein
VADLRVASFLTVTLVRETAHDTRLQRRLQTETEHFIDCCHTLNNVVSRYFVIKMPTFNGYSITSIFTTGN